ncbi:MAG: secretin and TonB N-terminal domain-containing protein [Nitrospira sp.]|nr:secretin and TonB N-terminal domain-containing protein [Nitrospira sp.]
MRVAVGMMTMCSRRAHSWIGCALLALTVGCGITEVRVAEQLGAQGDWDGAVKAYRDALKLAPVDFELQRQLDYAKAQAADMHFVAGQRVLGERQIDEAILEFKTALGLNPGAREYHVALSDVARMKEARDVLQMAQKLRSGGRTEEAMRAYERALELDPDLQEAVEGVGALTAQARAGKGGGGGNQPITLRFQNAKLKEVFEVLTKTSGLSVVFDKEVRDDAVTIFIKDMPADDALNLILNTNGLLAQRVGEDTLLIIPNTKQKLAQYQDLMIRTFYLSNAKAKDAVNLIRAMFESKRVYVDEKINAIVMRDEPAKLQLAERVLQSIDRKDPEVQLDVEVLEVDRTKSQKYGVNFAKAAGAGVFPDASKGVLSTAPTPFTYQQLASIGTGSYLFTIPGSVLLDFFKNDTDAKTLASPKLRVLNNKQASIQVGDKQPILLSTTNVLPGQAATGAIPTTSTVTSIEFKDVGVKLTVEPVMNLSNELTLKLKVEVTRLGDQVTLQASPEIKQFKFGTRTAETVLMLRDDETIVLGGLIQDDIRKTRTTIPILGDIPYLKYLFTTWTEDVVSTEVVLTITPHIIRGLTGAEADLQAYWSGTESNYSTAPLFAAQATPIGFSASAGVGKELGKAAMPLLIPQAGASSTGRPGPHPPAVTAAPSSQSENGLRSGFLSVRPAEVIATVGNEVQIDLTMGGVTGSVDTTATIAFNPQAVEFIRTLEGDLVSVGEGGAGLSVVAGATPGLLTVHFRQGSLSGREQGIVAKLVFAAKAAGTSPLLVQSAAVRGPGGVPMSVAVESGLVVVR